MRDHHIELSEAEQKWFIAILLAGAVYYMGIALAFALPVMTMSNVIERLLG